MCVCLCACVFVCVCVRAFVCVYICVYFLSALCRPLRNPVFGGLSVTSYTPGSVVRYSCDHGFILRGSPTSKCVHHDNHYFWHPDPPVCGQCSISYSSFIYLNKSKEHYISYYREGI